MALKKKDYCRAAMYCVIAAIVLIIDTFSIYICCDVTDIIVYIITEINTFRCPLFFFGFTAKFQTIIIVLFSCNLSRCFRHFLLFYTESKRSQTALSVLFQDRR